MIEGLDFVYYGPEPWAGMWRNRHHLLSRLARCNRVVYVEPQPYLRPLLQQWVAGTLDHAALWSGCLQPLAPNLWRYRPPAHTAVGGGPLWRPIAARLRVAHLRRTLREIGIDRPVVWLSHPSQAFLRHDLDARLRVYHVVDEYLGYFGVDDRQRARLAAWEDEIIAWADLVIVVSSALAEAKRRAGHKIHVLPNAADLTAFDAALTHPTDLGLPRPVIGYVGLISSRLDLKALVNLAQAQPAWSLVFVGEVVPTACEGEIAALRASPNVHLLGVRPAAEIPALIAGWDVGLIPYCVNTETEHASPLKLYEYLAAGLPVVSADVPAVRPFASLVYIVPEGGSYAEAIARALAENSAQARLARWAAVRSHSWDARVETLSRILVEGLAAAR